MAKSYSQQTGPGHYIATTNVWDVQEIYATKVTSPEFKELLVRLYQNLNNMALAINNKDTGLYPLTEFVNSQLFFADPNLDSSSSQTPTQRQVFRKVINFGGLPNSSGSKQEAHNINITDGYTFTRIYGTASDTTGHNYIPLPYASSVAADIIELKVNDTHVIITVASDKSDFNQTYVVLEYIKQ